MNLSDKIKKCDTVIKQIENKGEKLPEVGVKFKDAKNRSERRKIAKSVKFTQEYK